jgi:FkbM family methyltransferase
MIKRALRKLLGKNYKKMNGLFWRIISISYPFFFSKKGTLVYAGVNVGDSFQKIFFRFETVIGFEPNIKNFERLSYYNKISGVSIYNYALSNKKETVNFYLPDNKNNDASASLSRFSETNRYQVRDVITVNTINLSEFLKEKSISKIDLYMSDIEGFDYKVLKTLYTDYISIKKINQIQVEAVNNKVENPYKDCSNYEKDFDSLLLKNYKKIGRGSGLVKAGDDFSGKTLDVLYELI